MKKILFGAIALLAVAPPAIASTPIEETLRPCVSEELSSRLRPAATSVTASEKVSSDGVDFFYMEAIGEESWGFYIQVQNGTCELIGSEIVQPISTLDLIPEEAALKFIRLRFKNAIAKEGIEVIKPRVQKYWKNLSDREIQVAKELGLL